MYAARTPTNPPWTCGATGHKRRGRNVAPGSTRRTRLCLRGQPRPAHYYKRWGKDEVSLAIRERERTGGLPASASLPSSSSPVDHNERIAWFGEQARRAYLAARARGVKHPSLAPETYMARSHLRYWQSVKWRRESGFTVEGGR